MGRIPLTKIDIINFVSDYTGLSKVKAKEEVETIIRTIKESLKGGESVILRRFGSLQDIDPLLLGLSASLST